MAHVDLSVKELRALLRASNISTDGCCEKSDLVALADEQLPVSAEATLPAAPAASTANSDLAESAAPDWSMLCTRELRKFLVERGIGIEGCCERGDFLERAEQNCQALAVTAASNAPDAPLVPIEGGTLATHAPVERRKAMSTKEMRERREQVSGIKGDAGYAVDMFGAKRGRCKVNSSCFRFKPPHPKAGQMMATAICDRCGHHANEHENRGQHQRGEPELVDENGRRFRVSLKAGGGAHDAPTIVTEPMDGRGEATVSPGSHYAPAGGLALGAAARDFTLLRDSELGN
jgi:hypothetical protein